MTESAERGRQGQQIPRAMIGRYRLTRKLGSGSFATVWQGHDDDLDVEVAVKVLADNWADNADVRNRFLGEARIMRRIRDPRIVRVYDIGTIDDGRPYFVMDYADGGSLENLRRDGMDPIRALRLCAEGCRALNVLHDHDIVHRDVTPGNLLLSRTSTGLQVLVADLGVAKLMVGQSGATMTAGTPAYMALEQALGMDFDRRADIYSLGAVTYAMLTGRPPFPVKSLAELLNRDQSQPPVPIAARVGAPPALDALMLSVLSPEPSRRPPTAALLAEALDQIADQMSTVPQQAGTAGSPGQPVGQPPWQPGMAQGSLNQPSQLNQPGPMNQPSQMNQPGPMGPSPISFPTPGSYVQQHATPASMISQPPMSDPGFHSDLSGPPPEPESRRGRLFYLFLGIAALALFFGALLITVVVLN